MNGYDHMLDCEIERNAPTNGAEDRGRDRCPQDAPRTSQEALRRYHEHCERLLREDPGYTEWLIRMGRKD